MNRQTRSRLTAAGTPTCSVSCRYERGKCPLHGHAVTMGTPGGSFGPESAVYVGHSRESAWLNVPQHNRVHGRDCACACGFVVGHAQSCALFGSGAPHPAAAPPVAGASLPPGWALRYGCVVTYDHVSKAFISGYSDGTFAAETADKRRAKDKYATMPLAMCAALGIRVYEIRGVDWAGWCWEGNGKHDSDAPPGDWPTADTAALAALHAHAPPVEAKARQAGAHPFRIGDRVRCVDTDGVKRFRVGAEYTITSFDGHRYPCVDGESHGTSARFELVQPVTPPNESGRVGVLRPGWSVCNFRHNDAPTYQHESIRDRYSCPVQVYWSNRSHGTWDATNNESMTCFATPEAAMIEAEQLAAGKP